MMGHGGARRWARTGSGDENDRPSGRVPRRRLVADIAKLFRPYRGAVGGIGLVVMFTAGLGVVNPLMIKYVFDTALFPCGGRCPPDLARLYVLVGVMIAIPVM